MNEVRRNAYLDAMGIATYVARGQLPGAAPSLRRAVLPPASVPAPPVLPTTLLREAAPGAAEPIALSDPALPPKTGTEAGDQRPPGGAVVRFSLAAILAGGLLWLEALQDGPLSAEQVQLVQGMARALGASDEKPQVSRFDWPMHNNQQLDLGEGAASAALAGFIGRKLEQQACHGVVLLGEQCRQRVPLDQLGAAIVVSTVSTAEMLVDSRRKREAWRDLQPLRGQA
jgi:hypothetical protein